VQRELLSWSPGCPGPGWGRSQLDGQDRLTDTLDAGTAREPNTTETRPSCSVSAGIPIMNNTTEPFSHCKVLETGNRLA
jgi:hypothetical protein